MHLWSEAARHFDELKLSAIVMQIALLDVWNRLHVATRQISGELVEQYI